MDLKLLSRRLLAGAVALPDGYTWHLRQPEVMGCAVVHEH